jgi:hypothetical protein
MQFVPLCRLLGRALPSSSVLANNERRRYQTRRVRGRIKIVFRVQGHLLPAPFDKNLMCWGNPISSETRISLKYTCMAGPAARGTTPGAGEGGGPDCPTHLVSHKVSGDSLVSVLAAGIHAISNSPCLGQFGTQLSRRTSVPANRTFGGPP